MGSLRDFKPTQSQIAAAETVFTAMAFVDLIRPIVLGYETEILAKHQFPVSSELAPYVKDLQVVLNPKDSYLLSKGDQDIYFTECSEARKAAGLYVEKEEYCPLLVAEDNLRTAQHCLIEELRPITNVSLDMLLCVGDNLDSLNQYIDLSLRLLAPFVRPAKEILADSK